MLAEKLINNLTYDTDREVTNVELLKLRFGDASMHHAEVMVHDVEDSKRVNANVRTRLPDSPVDAVLVSHVFWPTLVSPPVKLHPAMTSELEAFGKAFTALKSPRQLEWYSHIGTVDLELELDGDDAPPRHFSVSPLHATLVMHCADEPAVTLAALALKVGVAETAVARKMLLWVNAGVVRAEAAPDGAPAYALQNAAEAAQHSAAAAAAGGGPDDVDMQADAEDGSNSLSEAAAAEEQAVYKNYITGMLTNLGALPLDRIHNFLIMLLDAADTPYDKNPQQLAVLLGRLCSEEGAAIELVDGQYQNKGAEA